jgi:TldD protein
MSDHLLDAGLCQRLLSAALERGGDFAEVFAERSATRSLAYEEGKVRSAAEHQALGVGIRVLAGERTGYAYCEELDEAVLLATARRAGAIARGAPAGAATLVERVGPPARYRQDRPMAGLALPERIALLAHASQRAYGRDRRMSWVSAQLSDHEQHVTIATSDGTFASDQRPLVRLIISAYAADGTRREHGYDVLGGRVGRELFTEAAVARAADEAARRALLLLAADEAPAGEMPVVLGPGNCGVLVHEAVGHGLEADFNRKGVSCFSGRIGEQVASPSVTVVDDGTIAGDRGALALDDEGVPAGRTVLIERGRLVGYLQDRLSARLTGAALTGNGRRQSYAHVPQPRMRCTYLLGGDDDPAEVIGAVRRGLYVAFIGGGSVDITKGDFNFNVVEGYRIEDGRLGAPVRGATLIGNGPEAMRRVERVGREWAVSADGGTCGKYGQGVPVNDGMATTLVSALVVGGKGKA